MKPVGVIGINLDVLRILRGTDAYNRSGANFGNILFTNSIYKVVHGCEVFDFKMDVCKARSYYSAIIIPAANWINKKKDLSDLAELLSELGLPVVVVGLGAQLESLDDAVMIPSGTIKFLHVVSELTPFIAVRGDFTKSIIENLGIKNVKSLGCPSILTNREIPKLRLDGDKRTFLCGYGSTRYGFPRDVGMNANDIQRQIYQYAFKTNSPIFFQSENFEIKVLNREELSGDIESAEKYYSSDRADLVRYLLTKGVYYTDIDQWINNARKLDVYIGTRVHGVIAALLAGTKGILITHDNRTRELAESMGLANIDIKNFKIEMLLDIYSFVNHFNFEKYLVKSENNFSEYKSLFLSCGLKLKF